MTTQNQIPLRRFTASGKPITNSCRCKDCAHWRDDVNLISVGISGVAAKGYCSGNGIVYPDDLHAKTRLRWCRFFYGYAYELDKEGI